MKLSIIIPTLNEERDLPNLLNSIKKQSFNDYEIIVADNKSKDKTRSIAKKFKCRIVKGGLPPEARNNGAKIAKGDYLLFLDADVILSHNFLEETLNEFESRKIDIATTEFIPLSDKKIDKMMYDFSNNFVKAIQFIKPFGAGFCILIKKDIHNKIKGFNENLVLCEDHDYNQRAAKFGKFRVLKKPKIFISVRRFEKEGRRTLALKYAKSTIYHIIGGKIKKNSVKYEWGNYN
ncbi:MAG: glycosyltransferase [Nanoarchaeota archaeon]|nr:glycosyltransferase [Nanoarchaeota archaeon]MBU0963134.1 glycosyltransferase [Nanoarchaeota archaeon]